MSSWLEETQQDHENIEQFLYGMLEYPPPIPDNVMMHVLAEAGLPTTDPAVHRTLNVACQKFISDVIQDCENAANQRVRATQKSNKKTLDLQVCDLKIGLENHGIHIHRPEFIVSIPKAANNE